MKFFSLILTLFLQFLLVYYNRLLDHISLIMLVLMTMLAAGGLMNMQKSRKSRKFIMMRKVGWGMMVGSLASILAIFLFLLWLPRHMK